MRVAETARRLLSPGRWFPRRLFRRGMLGRKRPSDTLLIYAVDRRLVRGDPGQMGVRFSVSDAPTADTICEPTAVTNSREMLFLGRHEGEVVCRMRAMLLNPLETRALVGEALDDERIVFVYDCFTEPVWRGRGLYGGAMRWLAESPYYGGTTRFVLTVNEGNRAARRAAEKCGFTSIGRTDA